MGIQGLLPMLKEIQVHGHIDQFRGKRLAVDAYVWLHKGAFGCAEALVRGEKTTRFVDYAMHRVRLLRHFGIEPYIVFDGGPLPAKKGTEVSRAKSRAENLAKAQALEAQCRGKEARDFYTKCVDITPEMAYQLIKALRAEQVDYVVAPYEADAQLCFLEREGYVDGIITEDSDLLVFGCKQVIFKLDNNGQCVSIHRDRLATLSEFPMHGWTDLQFRRMAMLSGCDYLPSISGIGIKTAHKLLRRYKTVEKTLQTLRLEGAHSIPVTYAKDFAQAELAFIHQRIFDPETKRLMPLNPFPEDGLAGEDEKWIGLDVEEDVACGMAKGDLHPETREPIEDQWPDYKPADRTPLNRTISSKPVLQNTSRTNVSAGPMDAFVSRTKRTKSAPLPKPIGQMASGPSRLSEQALYSRSAQLEAQEAGPSRPRRSKFFASKTQTLEDAVAAEAEALVWLSSDANDRNDDIDGAAQPFSSPLLESVRSPSPVMSPLATCTSPLRGDDRAAIQLTSPAASRCSTPAVSSPVHGDAEDPFLPPRKRSRASSPKSPSRAYEQSSSTRALGAGSSVVGVCLDSVMETPVRAPLRPLSRLPSVLIPASSPLSGSIRNRPSSARAVDGISSDSIEDEELVTPSVETSKRKRAISTVKIQSDEEVQEAEREQEAKAKVISAGWRAKYALKGASFPAPRSTRTTNKAPMPAWHDPILSPPPKPANVLTSRPLNVPQPFKPNQTPLQRDFTALREMTTPKTFSPINDHQPRSLLEKFRFTGRPGLSSPTL